MTPELFDAVQQALKELSEARKIIRASQSRHLAKDWDQRATDALASLRRALTQRPAAQEADWRTPTTYAQRFTEAVVLLCREMPPADLVAGWIDRGSDDHRLQDWACERAPSWAQGIGLLDAAHVMADQPTEGVDHEPAQPAAAGVSDAEIDRIASENTYSVEHPTRFVTDARATVRAILALRPQAVPMTDEVKVAEALRRIKALNSREYGDSAFYLSYVAEMLESCPDCQGNGYGDDFQECPTCNGSGKRHGITAQGAQGGEG